MASLPLFFLHGWATNSRIWHDIRNCSGAYFYDAPTFPALDHAASAFINYYGHMEQQAIVLIGWSLGGMLALQLAHRFPERVAGVVLISSTACFTTRDNYTAGLSPAIVKRLAKRLRRNHRQTQLDFYKLMFSAREQTASATFCTDVAPLMREIPPAALSDGLDYLISADLRDIISQITLPCHIIHGSADEICPLDAGRYLAEHLPQSVLHVLPDAGHIPFYTRGAEFQAILRECLANDQ